MGTRLPVGRVGGRWTLALVSLSPLEGHARVLKAQAQPKWGYHTWGQQKEGLRVAGLLSLGHRGYRKHGPDWPPGLLVSRRSRVRSQQVTSIPVTCVGSGCGLGPFLAEPVSGQILTKILCPGKAKLSVNDRLPYPLNKTGAWEGA